MSGYFVLESIARGLDKNHGHWTAAVFANGVGLCVLAVRPAHTTLTAAPKLQRCKSQTL